MRKILPAVAAILLCLLILPALVLYHARSVDAMGYMMLFFLALYPVLAVGLGMLAGTDPKKLWWLPVASALLFPPFFWMSIDGVVWALYIYSAIYLGLSLISALPVALIRYARALKKKS